MYHRDRDAHTRGAGAVAAVDGQRSARRQALLADRARRSRARDVALSEVARGTLGAIRVGETGGGGGGGRLPVAPGSRFGAPKVVGGLIAPRSPLTPRPGAGGTTDPRGTGGRIYPGAFQPQPVFPRAGQVKIGTYKPPMMVAPVLGTPKGTATPIPVRPVPSVTGGSLSPAVSAIPPAPAGPVVDEFDALDPDSILPPEEGEVAAPPASGPSRKTLFLIAGGLAAFLLLKG